MDSFDPKLLGDSAEERTVIVFDNKDDSRANDLTQGTYGEMEDGAAEFIEAPNAQLIFYSDSGHGCPVQYRELVAEHIRIFLDRSLDD